MRSTRSGRLVVAMEEEQARLEAEAAEAATAQKQTEDEIAAAADERVQEVTETHDDVEELDDSVEDLADEHQGIDEAMDTVEAMESLAAVIGAAKNAGTMTRVAAEAMFVMIDHVDRRTGYKAESKVSLESFGGPSATKRSVIALEEEVQGRLAKIWEAIKSAVKRSIEWIASFVSNLFKNADRLMARAKKMESAFNGFGSSGNPGETKIENEKLFKALALSGKVEADTKATEVVKTLISSLYGHLPKISSEVEKIVAELQATSKAKIGVVYSPDEVFAGAGLSRIDKSKVDAHGLDPEFSAMATPELPGGKSIVVAVDKYNSAHVGLEFLVGQKEPVGKDVALFNAATGARVAKEVMEIAKELAGGKSKVSGLTAAKRKMLSGMDNVSKFSKGMEEMLVGKATLNAIRSSVKFLDVPFVVSSNYAIHTGYALLEQAELSLKSIKANDKNATK